MTENGYPDYISFTDAADLVVRQGITGSLTARGLRYMANARLAKTIPAEQRWPFGDGPEQEKYLQAGRTRMMRTATLLEYLRKYPPTGRGTAKSPRNDTPEQ